MRSNIYLHNKLLPVAILVFFQLKMIWLYLLSNKVLPCLSYTVQTQQLLIDSNE